LFFQNNYGMADVNKILIYKGNQISIFGIELLIFLYISLQVFNIEYIINHRS